MCAVSTLAALSIARQGTARTIAGIRARPNGVRRGVRLRAEPQCVHVKRRQAKGCGTTTTTTTTRCRRATGTAVFILQVTIHVVWSRVFFSSVIVQPRTTKRLPIVVLFCVGIINFFLVLVFHSMVRLLLLLLVWVLDDL